MRLTRTPINPARAKALMSLALTMGRQPQLSGARTKRPYRAEFLVTLPLGPVFLTKLAKPPPMAGRKQEVLQLRE